MSIIRQVPRPHKCKLPHGKYADDLYIGTVFRCNDCMAIYVLVALGENDEPIWEKTDEYVSDVPSNFELTNLADRVIASYGLEEDLWIKDDDDDREEEYYE